VTPTPIDLSHKQVLDAILVKLSGVEAGEMTGLLAYFVGKKMFACICNGGVGVRLSAADAANLQFSRNDVVPFEPKGRKSTREWIQINHEDSADYEKDMEVFQSSIAFVRASKG
jgi:hypothetical protein